MARHIKFLALAHDSKILASHTHWDKENREDYEAQLGNVFKTGQWGELMGGAKRKFELTSNENVYCIELDAQRRVYVCVITKMYPKRHIFSSSSGSRDPRLMTEFRGYVEGQLRLESVSAPEKGLRRALKPFLKALASRFDDLEGIDKVAATQAKAESVKKAISTTLDSALRRADHVDGLSESTSLLLESTKQFDDQAQQMKRAMCCRRLKWIAMVVGGVLLILTVVAVSVYFALFYKK